MQYIIQVFFGLIGIIMYSHYSKLVSVETLGLVTGFALISLALIAPIYSKKY